MAAVQSRRERLREATYAEIKTLARKQLQTSGSAAGISLRGIAEEMGMSAPAIYRYYPSRGDLVTVLIVDAYRSLGDAVNVAADVMPPDDYAGRFVAAAVAYRDWALAQSAEFMLIYGPPLPDYDAPEDETVPLVTRALTPFIAALQDALDARAAIVPQDYATAPESLRQPLTAWLETTPYPVSVPMFHYSVAQWGRMHGLVMLELNGQFHPMSTDNIRAIYRFEIDQVLKSVGLAQRG